MDNLTDNLSSIFYNLYKKTRPRKFIPSDKDVFLISYPRSGNTWMRVMMAEVLFGKSGKSLKELENYIPDIHYQPLTRDLVKSPFYIVKSHDLLTIPIKKGYYKKVVYLIRDPRDVVLSHFRYKIGRGYEFSFDAFLNDWLSGRIRPSTWSVHVNSWTDEGIIKHGIDIKIIRYEDLLFYPKSKFKEILDFICINKNDEEIQKAIDHASVIEMRNKERLGLREGENTENMKFIGDATNNQWQDKLTKEQIELIEKNFKNEMRRFGYL